MSQPIVKLGSLQAISQVHELDDVMSNPRLMEVMADDSAILNQFKKFADDLKKLAPKAKDFLYFSAIMMHSAEASILELDGSLKKDANGRDVEAHWEKSGEKGSESWKWVCSDSNIRPYKNSNNDIFPEEELIKAHKKWVGRPLCLDHKSSSVDMIRGVIVDTFYDRKHKRVIALCALDKINYPDLARKVSTGYATSVSMGTAVGRAICTDCGKVARIEPDFCDHMRRKSCYGEINVDLNPIELSIVVNGADPQAKIRHIVAAANSIAQYVDMRAADFMKLASDETRDIELCTEVEAGLDEIQHQVIELRNKIQQLKGNEEAEQKRNGDETVVEPDSAVAEASKEDAMLKNASSTLETLLKQVEQLNHKFNQLEESQMTTKNAYFQGGGGVNEPTPGKPKYEKEEADSIRNTKDKHMESVVDTGPVDGLFPGDEQKKRELLRLAELEAREQKRLAAVASAKEALEKSGYFQGAGGVNEPEPKKVKYTKEDADKVREKGDTHMHAPGTGKVDGLFDKDLEAKKKLLRAKLNAKFVKAAKTDGTLDLGESRWQVYADGNLIQSFTVNEITKGNADSLFNVVATKQFGLELIATIKRDGFEKAASMYKAAQVAPAADPMAAAPALPADAGLGGEEATDEGKSGDPKEQLATVSQDISNLSAQLLEISDALSGKTDDLGSFEELAAEPGVATAKTLAMMDMRKKLSHALNVGIKNTLDEVRDLEEELKLATVVASDPMFSKRADKKDAVALINDTCKEALTTIAGGRKLLGAFVKYARATAKLQKRAEGELQMKKSAQSAGLAGQMAAPLADAMKDVMGPAEAPHPAWQKAETGAGAAMPKAKPPVVKDLGGGAKVKLLEPEHVAALPPVETVSPEAPAAPAKPAAPKGHVLNQIRDTLKADDCGMADDAKKDEEKDAEKDQNDLKVAPDGAMEGTPEEVGKALKEKEAGESRAERRAKLAQKAVQWSDMLQKAHPGSGPTTQLDVKPTGDLAKVETLPEVHNKMMDLANAPPQVRKLAEDIQRCVVAGQINPETDFDNLVAVGLDSQAVAYWKKYYGQASDGGSQFASELVKEQAKVKAAEEQAAYRAKYARAWELATEMADVGLISKEASALNTQVSSIMEFNDTAFENLKRLVARQPVRKTAAAIPAVGFLGGSEVILPAPEAAPSDYKSVFERYFANKKF